jgi:hypothetical protein
MRAVSKRAGYANRGCYWPACQDDEAAISGKVKSSEHDLHK